MSTENKGKTTIAPEVLVSIAKLSALSVEGVSKLDLTHGGVNRFLNRSVGEGIKLNIENDAVYIEVYVILDPDVNVREVCHDIQSQINRAITEMVGMEVARVNVHVEDIDFEIAA